MFNGYPGLALKNLRRRGIRSWLTLLGIFIGIMAVVALISLGNGLKAAVISQFGTSTTELITIQAGGITGFGAPGQGAANKLTIEDVNAIERISSVDKAIGMNIPSVKIEYDDELIISAGWSVPDEREDRNFMYEVSEFEIEKGRFLKDGDGRKVVLGNNFLTKNAGFDKEIEVGDSIDIQGEEFDVVGILKKKGSFISDNAVLVNREILKDISNFDNEVDIIDVKVKNKDLMDRAAEDIEDLLRKRRDVEEGEEDFSLTTPEQSLQNVNNILGGVQAFIVIIASVSIIVGAIGIINTMTTSVLERKKEIGIMKAVGAKNIDIFYQFFFEAGFLGLIGGIVGVIFGVLIGYAGTVGINNFLGSSATPNIDYVLIFWVLVGSFLIGSIAGILPAMKATKQNPVEALRS